MGSNPISSANYEQAILALFEYVVLSSGFIPFQQEDPITPLGGDELRSLQIIDKFEKPCYNTFIYGGE